ncbi:Endonuclease, Uma2 family (restriction endonuclease fold) [Amycolatopsis arida]|uniref:Endonuclease, Uma2 family (Restriction endonuclease fold) n=1 Tax=Amycolatopsis arida TaxID=587909 RepID=A0A1I5R127_9PSEU|nr:Uma2 family endonuclease [Amycolatopsis arida]TDX99035.1 Uma2 family endonuclease [Amycolatopsis arida]SFP52199.1 Endonuclease, Uma2 family (restriction endonuclease fold) [Amycolatopsis arida]
MSVAIGEHVGPWTIADVEALADAGDHSRYELLTPGVLTASPAPGFPHQRASRRLANALEQAALTAGAAVEVLEAVNVEAPRGRLAVPDIAVIEREFAATDPTRCPPGTVLAVVEIVSPGSEPHDRLIKPQLYADTGIAFYWRFELTPEPHIVVSELRRGQYIETVTAPAGARSVIPCTFPVELDPAELVRQ